MDGTVSAGTAVPVDRRITDHRSCPAAIMPTDRSGLQGGDLRQLGGDGNVLRTHALTQTTADAICRTGTLRQLFQTLFEEIRVLVQHIVVVPAEHIGDIDALGDSIIDLLIAGLKLPGSPGGDYLHFGSERL